MSNFAKIRPGSHFPLFAFLISLFWYLSLFPGRLGFDYSEAIRMMHQGKSTDWWTGSFWWFLRITSFDGKTIALSSLISITIFGLSFIWFVRALPGSLGSKNRATLIFFATPIYGAFGVNVSHDVFQAAGIILIIGIQIRHFRKVLIGDRQRMAIEIAASALLMTTAFGPFLVAINVFLLLLQHKRLLAISILIFTAIFYFVTSQGVTNVPKHGLKIPVVADIKCVAQHPQAAITQDEWAQLIQLAPKAEWLIPTTCSFIDDQLGALSSLELSNVKLDKNLAKLYLSITAKNPAIVAMAHFQRASQALPPPFFQGPVNQVILDPSVPIGQGTNIALQTGAQVLHPSIDEPSVDHQIAFLKPLEMVAQGPIFVVNQASWFWGWGGLWLWPIFIYLVRTLHVRKLKHFVAILSPMLGLHAFLLILSAPLPRYVMSAITIGFFLTILMIVQWFEKINHDD